MYVVMNLTVLRSFILILRVHMWTTYTYQGHVKLIREEPVACSIINNQLSFIHSFILSFF